MRLLGLDGGGPYHQSSSQRIDQVMGNESHAHEVCTLYIHMTECREETGECPEIRDFGGVYGYLEIFTIRRDILNTLAGRRHNCRPTESCQIGDRQGATAGLSHLGQSQLHLCISALPESESKTHRGARPDESSHGNPDGTRCGLPAPGFCFFLPEVLLPIIVVSFFSPLLPLA